MQENILPLRLGFLRSGKLRLMGTVTLTRFLASSAGGVCRGFRSWWGPRKHSVSTLGSRPASRGGPRGGARTLSRRPGCGRLCSAEAGCRHTGLRAAAAALVEGTGSAALGTLAVYRHSRDCWAFPLAYSGARSRGCKLADRWVRCRGAQQCMPGSGEKAGSGSTSRLREGGRGCRLLHCDCRVSSQVHTGHGGL